jgi:hypothetical protein
MVMVGFGGGLSWGATLVEWGVPMPYKKREWWYRSVRWFVYWWAGIRSGYLKLARRAEGWITKNGEYLGSEKTETKHKESQKKTGRNGSEPDPDETSEKTVVTEPAEGEPVLVDSKQSTNGKKK